MRFPSPIQDNRFRLRALGGAGVVGGFAALALAILAHAAYVSWRVNREVRSDISHWEAQIRLNQQKQQALESYFRSSEAKQVLDRSSFLNSLIGQRSFPWTRIFMDLEGTLPPGVRVVNISPRLEEGRALVELTVGAATDEGKLKFLEALEKSRVFTGIQVKDERRPDQSTSQDRVVVNLTVWYATI
jgi:hypothetical protein